MSKRKLHSTHKIDDGSSPYPSHRHIYGQDEISNEITQAVDFRLTPVADIRVGDILHFKPSGFKGKIGHIAPITVEAYPAGVLALQTYTSREDEYYIPFKVTEQVYISRKWDC